MIATPSSGEPRTLGQRLNDILFSYGEAALAPEIADRFGTYAALLMKWNARMNLTAVRDEEGILRRHFVESIICARALPSEVCNLLDFGSGAGFPGIPIALCRSEIAVTLGESQGKKAAFLNEAARVLDLSVKVYGGRVEALSEQFECVTLRAVDRMGVAVRSASGRVADPGWLALLTTIAEAEAVKGWAGGGYGWETRELPGAAERILLLGVRRGAAEQQAVR